MLPRVLALSKADLVDADTRDGGARGSGRRALGADMPVIVTSSATRARARRARRPSWSGCVPAAEAPEAAIEVARAAEELAEHRVFRPAADARVPGRARSATGSTGSAARGIERLVARYDLDNADALAYLERRLRGIGVIRALQEEGFEPGDEVEIAGIAFDLDPE